MKTVIKVTTPQDKREKEHVLNDALKKFEQVLRKQENGKDCYYAQIEGELSRMVCNDIEKIYMDAGWKNVTCKTTTETKSEVDTVPSTHLQLHSC